MLLSRFWYLAVAIALAGATYLLVLATGMYNRQSAQDTGQVLTADSQVVDWYLRNDARRRAAELLKPAYDPKLAKALLKASNTESQVPESSKVAARAALSRVATSIARERAFTALFAVDKHGRVVAHHGFDVANGIGLELGGYPVVADALHGYVRDDVLALDSLYRVVARPVEYEAGMAPVGAIMGARLIDDSFVRELTRRTGAAVAFYWDGARKASAAPEGFQRSQLDAINEDLPTLDQDADYADDGRSKVRRLPTGLQVVYSKLPGESWQSGGGYAVAKYAMSLASPFAFFDTADDKDKAAVPVGWALLVLFGIAGVGLVLTVFEHTRPLRRFRKEVHALETGSIDRLRAAGLNGAFRDSAAAINDAIDRLVEQHGGQSRRGADLGEVLGDLPPEPVMSAFSFPGDSAAPEMSAGVGAGLAGAGMAAPGSSRLGPSESEELDSALSAPPGETLAAAGGAASAVTPASPVTAPAVAGSEWVPSNGDRGSVGGHAGGESSSTSEAPPASAAATGNGDTARAGNGALAGDSGGADGSEQSSAGVAPTDTSEAGTARASVPEPDSQEERDVWRGVFEDFVAIRKRLGDPAESFTFEKFERTLRKNRGAIQTKHGCRRVRFRAYVKDGKAALKASPVRD